MTDNFLSSLHIQKLSHNLEEIRIRALNHIISKLNLFSDSNFSSYLLLLKKLFKWFDFQPLVEEEKVLNLILKILQSENGELIINHSGKDSLITDLLEIKKIINPRYYRLFDDILKILNSPSEVDIVPPLISDLPLSYRSDQTDFIKYKSNTGVCFLKSPAISFSQKNASSRSNTNLLSSYYKDVESTATPFTGREIKNASVSGLETGNSCELNLEKEDSVLPLRDLLYKSVPFATLNWQLLVKSDYHILKSVEESLLKPPTPTVLLHSCDFFCNVILQDYPAEIFLQRPEILLLFYDMVNNSPSTRITNAALVCLNKLTENLIIRIKHYNDPCTFNNKEIDVASNDSKGADTSKGFTYYTTQFIIQNIENDNEINESTIYQCNQKTLPQYCMQTFVIVLNYIAEKPQSFKESGLKKKTQSGINTALQLLNKLVNLLSICIKSSIWNNQRDTTLDEIAQKLRHCLEKLGYVLEHYRLMVVANDMESFERMAQLYLLHITANLLTELIPISKADLVLPKTLKSALSSNILDASFGRLYPGTHEILVQYVNEFKGNFELESLTKYKDVKAVCRAITKGVKIIKMKSFPSENILDTFYLIQDSLPSFEFHKNLNVINKFLKYCVKHNQEITENDKLMKITSDILVSFLSHSDEDIRKETYSLCQKLIVNILGVNHTQHMNEKNPGSQVIFFFQPEILIVIASYGITNDSLQIQTQAEDILLHILKCKFTVSESVWKRIIKCVSLSMPLLQCHANLETPLGKAIIKLTDPDVSPSIFMSQIDTLKGNMRFLFAKNINIRNEAVSRLSWLLSTEDKSYLKVPKIKSLDDLGLRNIFQLEYPIDLSKKRSSTQFYQMSSLLPVIELLQTKNIEPSIRRSALNQLSVMLDDYALHSTFIEHKGLDLVLHIFDKSLYDKECNNYLDSVLPVISILKSISLHNSIIRQELSNDIQLIFNILRGLILYCTDLRLQQDAALLCCLLLFSEYVIFSYSGRDFTSFSIPDVVFNSFYMPFKCETHWKTSRFTKPSLTGLLMSDDWCKSIIRMYWNIDWYEGVTELINWENVPSISNLTNEQLSEFSADLRITRPDLLALKASSIEYCCKQFLYDIENATTHQAAIEGVRGITGYIELWLISKKSSTYLRDTLLDLPWNSSFCRFLSAPPASAEDQSLLIEVLRCLLIMTKMYKNSEKHCWIFDILNNQSHYLFNSLKIETNTEQSSINLEFLTLIAECCKIFNKEVNLNYNWKRIVNLISENLKYCDTDQFYNLAFLDKLLLCLVQITSNLGWSEQPESSYYSTNKVFSELIDALSELLISFHCGKGSEASSSFMGFSIIRNALLTLNHILYEMQIHKKNWETFWCEIISESTIINLFSFWICRDVVIRAATLQFLSGFALSPRGVTIIVENVRLKYGGVWETTLMILLDHNEASLVKEQAALLLANICSHTSNNGMGHPVLALCHAPLTANQDISGIEAVLLLLKEYNFFDEINTILSNLHLDTNFDPMLLTTSKSKQSRDYNTTVSYRSYILTSTESSKSNNQHEIIFTTPSLVKALANFIINLLHLAPDKIAEQMNFSGAIRSFFSCISTPTLELNDSKQRMLYSDILEMNTAVCSLLFRCAFINNSCKSMCLQTKDCLYILISLLNPDCYNVVDPIFYQLRNKLWCEIFRFLTALLEEKQTTNKNSKNDFRIINESYYVVISLLMECGHEGFIKSICESIESNFKGLQKSALQSLTSLLSIEVLLSCRNLDKSSSTFSIKSLLDETKTPRLSIDESTPNYTESNNVISQKSSHNTIVSEVYSKSLMLEESVSSKKVQSKKSLSSNKFNIMIGADLCKMLFKLYEVRNLDSKDSKNKNVIISALSSLLNVSSEAKKITMNEGLLNGVIKHLKSLHLELSLHSAELVRKHSERKKLNPILKEVDSIFCLLTNFMAGNEAKEQAVSTYGLADLVHKFWVWFFFENSMLVNILKFLCTLTADCDLASQSLTLTNPLPGSVQRKAPTNVSLLNEIINLISKQMDLVSKTHDITVLQLVFHIMQNVSHVTDCRNIFVKSNLLQSILKLHPSMTKRQRPWDSIEFIWLEFLETYTFYPEGQLHITNSQDLIELLISLSTSGSRQINKTTALSVLRNASFHHSNRIKLLASVEFIQLLLNKLTSGTEEEKNIVVTVIWSLAANSQKSKIALKCAGFDQRLQDLIKQYEIQEIEEDSYQTMIYVLRILKEGEK